MKFLVFGDLHYDEVEDGDRRIDELVTHIGEVNPDFVVSLGDLCKPIAENESNVLERFRATGVPIYHTIGNHESDGCTLADGVKFLLLDNSYYSFENDDIKFIVLNSCYFSKNEEEQPFYKKNYKGEG